MFGDLLRLYRTSRINPRDPKCVFADAELLNEGWLLRAVLWHWKTHPSPSLDFCFLPFPQQALVYSEGLLYPPFPRRSRDDSLGEGHTHADGIVGDFGIAGKRGIKLCQDARYLAVFEAKLFSPLSPVKNAPGYDQVSRTAACIVHAMLEAGLSQLDAHLVLLYPKESDAIHPAQHTRAHARQQIAARAKEYFSTEEAEVSPLGFRTHWEELLPYVHVHSITWEKVLAEIADPELNEFYELCLEFGRQA